MDSDFGFGSVRVKCVGFGSDCESTGIIFYVSDGAKL